MNNNDLYKCYSPLVDGTKKPKVKFDDSFSSIEEAKNYKNSKDICGYLKDDICYYDLDCHNEETKQYDELNRDTFIKICESEKLHTIIRKTTSGYHIYFRDTENRVKNNGLVLLACGLKAEIKHGGGKISDKIIENGIEREIVYDNGLGEIPSYFLPNKNCPDFLNISSGERNNALFPYGKVLRANLSLTEEETYSVMKVINDYVLKEPLSEKELKTICRPEALKLSSIDLMGKSFDHVKLGKHILGHCNVIKIDDVLYCYEDGFYQKGNAINRLIYKLCDDRPITRNQVCEVREYLQMFAPEKQQSDKRYILFDNGILDLYNMELLPCSPNYVITNRINWNYNKNAKSELLENLLDSWSCNDREIRNLIEESIGEALYRSSEHQKAFVLTGKGANGKTTFIHLIRLILGRENYSSSSMAQLSSHFGIFEVAGKLANLADEMPSFNSRLDTDVFKQLTGSSEVSADIKYRLDKVQFESYATLFLSANELPRIKFDYAIERRLLIIPFNANFQNEKKDTRLDEKMNNAEVIETAIYYGINGLNRVIRNGYFSKSKKSEKALTEYRKQNDSVYGFIADTPLEKIQNNAVEDVFNLYRKYCYENGFDNPLTKLLMSKEIRKSLKLDVKQIRIGKDNKRCYVKAEFSEVVTDEDESG